MFARNTWARTRELCQQIDDGLLVNELASLFYTLLLQISMKFQMGKVETTISNKPIDLITSQSSHEP